MNRTSTLVLAGLAVVLSGCKDMGLSGNIPRAEAEDRAPKPLVAAVMAPVAAQSQRLVVDGRVWIPTGEPEEVAASDLRAVGSAEGRTVYARTWDEPPYDALFTRWERSAAERAQFGALPGEHWQRFEPVAGRTGPLPPMEAADPSSDRGDVAP